MHIAVLEVLRPIHDRATERLGRRYVVAFEDTRLTVLRSGPNRPPSKYVEQFDTHEELIVNVKEKLKRRFYHGYVLIWWHQGFPLLNWIYDREYPVEYRAILPPGIQLELPFFDWPSDP